MLESCRANFPTKSAANFADNLDHAKIIRGNSKLFEHSGKGLNKGCVLSSQQQQKQSECPR